MIKLLFNFSYFRHLMCLYGFHKWEYEERVHQTMDSSGISRGDVNITHRTCLHCTSEEIPSGLMEWKRIDIKLGNVYEILLRSMTICIPIIWYCLIKLTN